ncbi:MAG: hypothetical protein KJZ47_14915 [Gemmatimonadales bacterium]|nr:hypothetical protein [Gemmatimonadales bacterium]
MSTGVRILSRPEVAVGFGLAGVSAETATDDADVALQLAGLLARRDLGVLLVEDHLYQALPEDARHQADRSIAPVVVPFPSPSWEPVPPAEQYVVELLRRAIGYRVRLG